ncbi:MAG: sialidase family protein [Bacteroidota bacterium]
MRIITAFFLILSLSACQVESTTKTSNPQTNTPSLISDKDKNASGPFFTKDEKGQAVLVWTEALAAKDATEHIVKFAKWNPSTSRFDPPLAVPPSAGCRAHDESMSKIAFKKDGTIVSVFSKRSPTPKNRFAGALYYTQSFDGGQQWTEARYLHVGDTSSGKSRSFFDLATLADGEVGAIWLDSRLTKKRGDGSSLFFAKTEGKNGFVKDQVIGTSTCECCRTDLFVADNGDLHAVYRDIWQDSIRDMSHLLSIDNGQTFSQAQKVSSDNWVVNGCPHTGPSIGASKDALHCAWFSMGGGQGIYYSRTVDGNQPFGPRKLVTNSGVHPQLVTTSTDKLVFLWEERNGSSGLGHHGHGHHQSSTETEKASSTTYVKAQIWENGNPLSEHWISQADHTAEYPVATELADGTIGVAWVQNTQDEGYGIFFRLLHLNI